MASEGQESGVSRPDADAATARPPPTPKLRRIEITNYKAIDHLVLEIPAPTMANDPDIFVVGSKNGVGKTSLLECCALAHLGKRRKSWTVIGDELKGGIRSGTMSFTVESTYDRGGRSSLIVRDKDINEFFPTGDRHQWPLPASENDALFGRSLEPLLRPDLLLFHSHRKVAEGPLRLQQMLDPRQAQDSSTLKVAIMSMLLAKSGLLEDYSNSDAELPLERLNEMLTNFAGGRVDKLRSMNDNRLDIRIATPGGASFSFDALSSGQKEMISTLFLIWHITRHRQALVLIDEPELHLNAEWQREFIHQLHALAPQNQYILATHSEDIFASVPEDRRVLLGPQG